MSDYRVDIRVRNNNFLKMLENCGYSSVGEFCRLNSKMKWAATIGDFINLKRSPIHSKTGKFLKVIYDICDVLKCSPEDLFSNVQVNTALESNKRSMQVGEAEMQFMLTQQQEVLGLEYQIDLTNLPDKIDDLLQTLTPREAKVISMRFGLGDYATAHTLKEVADEFAVHRERISQIEAKALRKLRHSSRRSIVVDYVEG